MGIADVPKEYLIEEVAKKLNGEIEKPVWMNYAKTQKEPQQDKTGFM